MKLINYGHACFKVIDDELSIIFDPYKDGSVPGLKLPDNLEANYVFASHLHDDHNAVNKVKLIPTNRKLPLVEISLPHDKDGGKSRGMSIARILKFPDLSICHLGDIGDIKQAENMEELKNIDVVLCPINGFFTISAEEALKLQKKLNWKALIPMHYYIKEDKSGYPDGGQIDIFKTKCSDYLEVDDYQIHIRSESINNSAIIFLKHK